MKKDNSESPILDLDYTKYLNCPKCKKVELYCPEHREEVEKTLSSL